MKRIALAILTVALMLPGVNSFAQGKFGADSAECVKYMSFYQEYFKSKSYDAALPSWRKAYKLCPPTASQNMLIHGATLLKTVIAKNANNAAYRAELVDSLMNLYDVRVATYPKSAVAALNNKGLDMANYIKNDPQRLFDGYQAIINSNKSATRPNIYIYHMNSAIELFQKGALDAEQVINTYQADIALLEAAPAKDDAEKEQNAKVKTDLESLFISSRVASCENLLALFTPRYQANPNDLDLVSNIVKMMSFTDGCQNNDLYLNAVTSMYKLDPSHTAAHALFKLNSARGNVQDAIKYQEEAIAAAESDNATDALYYYELASFCMKNSQSAKAFESAKKAVELDPSYEGKAYFLMGTIWGSASCGGDEITRRAPYWVAVDYLQKAKAADASLTEDANRLIGQYASYYPQTAEAFMYDITDGQSYTVSCGGMRATTVVRTQK